MGGQKLETLYYDIEGRTEKLSTGLAAAERRLQKFAGVIKAHPEAALGALAATAALAAVEMTKMAVQFDTSMRKATASIPGALSKLEAFKQGVLDLSRKTGDSVEELTDGLRILGQVGGREMGAPADAMRRLRLASDAAKASGGDLGAVIRSLDDVMDAFGLSGNTAAEGVLNIAFGAARGRAPLGELLDVLSKTGPAASAAGIPLNELAATSAALFEKGISAAEQVRALKLELTGVAEGGADAVTKLDRLGIRIEASGGHMQVVAGATQAFGDALQEATSHSTAMGEALDTALSGPGERWKTLMASLKATSMEIGSNLLDAVARAFDLWTLQHGLGLIGARPRPVTDHGVMTALGLDGTPVSRYTAAGSGRVASPTQTRTAQEIATAQHQAEQAMQAMLGALDRSLGDMKKKFTDGNLFGPALASIKHGVEDIIHTGQVGTDQWNAQAQAVAFFADQVRAARDAVADSPKEWADLNAQLEQAKALAAQMRQHEEAALRTTVKASKVQKDKNHDLLEQARNIEAAARGALQLASAFGLVDEKTAAALENIVQVAANVPALLAAMSKGGAAGIAAAALPVLGGLAGLLSGMFGDSPEAQQRKAELQANTEAIAQLTRTLGESQLAISGKQFSGVRGALGSALPHMVPDGGGPGGTPAFSDKAIRQALSAAGLSYADLQSVAAALGITLNSTKKSFEQLLAAMNEAELDRVMNSFAGQMELLQERISLFNVDDPIEQLTMLENAILGLGGSALDGLKQFDLTTAEGRAAAQTFLQSLFTRATTGGVGADQFGAFFGSLTPAEFLDAIQRLAAGIGSANGGGAGGTTETFGMNRSITEVTGSRIAATLNTIAYYNQLAADYLARLLDSVAQRYSIQPPSLDGWPAGGGTTVVIQQLVVQVSLPAGANPQQFGQAIAAATVTAIDQALGERQRRKLRSLGNINIDQ